MIDDDDDVKAAVERVREELRVFDGKEKEEEWCAHLAEKAELVSECAALRARVAELEAQAAKDDAHVVEVNDAHLKQVAALRTLRAGLERERDEAVAALRGLLRDEWYTYEGNLEASGRASVDDLNAARAVLAKYPEGR